MPRKQKRGEFKSVEGDFFVNTVGKHARHAFVVPTYDKSPYLEECLASLASQQRQSAIHIATSTPFEGIRSVCDRYGASLFVHGPNRGIGADWNAALGGGNADLVTIAHQDDIYLRVFSEQVMAAAERYPDCGFYFTAVSEFEANGQRRAGSVNNWVKDMLLASPLSHLQALVNTAFSDTGRFLLKSAVGVFGWLDVYPPSHFYVIAAMAIVGVVSLNASAKPSGLRIGLFAWLVAADVVIVVCIPFYVYWTTPQSSVIEGLQGRYFIPLIAFVAMCGSFRMRRAWQGAVAVAIVASVPVMSIISLASIFDRYYM